MLVSIVTADLVIRSQSLPGAIGIYGAGATGIRGDSFVIAAALSGTSLSPEQLQSIPPWTASGYFAGADPDSDLTLSPASHPQVLAQFPPTQLITGSRALDLSPAIITHAALVDAGAEAELHVREGMGHCFITRAEWPEAQAATQAIARFFDRHLGRAP
jgi:acetyl esterase/lipase